MALIDINKNPSKKDLAWFGVLMAAFFGFVGFMAWRRSDSHTTATVLWTAGVVLPVLYFAIPPIRRPMFLGWLYAAFPIGWVVSHVLLGAIFYVVFTGVGILMRVFGVDPMTRKLLPEAKTYWIEHRPCDAKPSRYFRQY